MTPDDPFKGRTLAAAKAKRLQPPPAASPTGAPRASAEAEGRMVDVGAKPIVPREAVAEGALRLRPETLAAILEGRAPKGDPFAVARIAGIQAAKATPQLIPLCHPIPLTSVEVDLTAEGGTVRARATVRASWRTGVEMEALAAVTVALLTVWDMSKSMEKDDSGNYPATRLEDVRVVSKTKGSP